MRLRARYRKLGKIRFTSHRDTCRSWERALRRAELPVATTQGFSPRPKLHFGLALPTSHESLGEYLDIDLREGAEVDIDELPELLSTLLPAGLDVDAVRVVPTSGPSLQEAIGHCTWLLEFVDVDPSAIRSEMARILAAPSVMVRRERKGVMSSDDIRPGILDLRVVPSDSNETASITIEADLGTQPRSVRPLELLAAFDPAPRVARIRRLHQWINDDGAMREPLDATSHAPAEVGA